LISPYQGAKLYIAVFETLISLIFDRLILHPCVILGFDVRQKLVNILFLIQNQLNIRYGFGLMILKEHRRRWMIL